MTIKTGNEKLAQALLKVIIAPTEKEQKNEVNSCEIRDSEIWVCNYDKSSMTFQGSIQQKNVKVLIDTGSFVTLVNKKVLEGLSVKKIDTDLKEIIGIGNGPKKILGAVFLEIEVGNNKLPLKCHIIEQMKYDIVLGRDMLDATLIAMDHIKTNIHFRKGVCLEDVNVFTSIPCFLTH